MVDITYWFMFPVGILISTIAMMSGIGGAVLFSPFFILVLKLEPVLALGSGLFIEMFGFSSGVIGYYRQKSISFSVVKRVVLFALVGTIVGVLVGRLVPDVFLKILLVIVLLYLTYAFIREEKVCEPLHPKVTGVHKKHLYTPVTNAVRMANSLGGLLIGMVSSGLGEINEYIFLRRMQMPSARSAGTSVFLVAVCAMAGVIAHLILFFHEGAPLQDVISVVSFTVPGVIIGAQFGVHFAKQINPTRMSKFVGFLFLFISLITLYSIYIQ